MKREAIISRKTNETQIAGYLNLDEASKPKHAPMRLTSKSLSRIHEHEMQEQLEKAGLSKKNTIDTGIGFFNHMLDLFAFHSGFDFRIKAKGDTWVDDHHTIEDAGILMGDLFSQALGDKCGIVRYGSFRMPMDEAFASVDLDFSGRPYLVFDGSFHREKVGEMSTEMVKEFLRAFCTHARLTLHVHFYGENDHHQIEAVFKALARALKQAVVIENDLIPSSKGMLE